MTNFCANATSREQTHRVAEITVAISTSDRPDSVMACIQSVLSGTALPAEVIIVDQSGDERTRALTDSLIAGTTPVRWIRHEGAGLGASQNIAFARAHCSVVAVIDDDCIAAPNWIETIACAFQNPGAMDVLTGRVLAFGPEIFGLYAVSSRTSTERRTFDGNAMPWEIGSGNNFAAKQSWFRRIGGNDERLGPGSAGQGGVDMDLFYRFLRAGAEIRYEPDLLVYHSRTTKAGRLARRSMYGHGMGAACMIHLRQGDRNALGMLGRWVTMRGMRMLQALRHLEWMGVYEELLVLAGTARGTIYGLRVANHQDRSLSRAGQEAGL